jgi:fructose-specific phosphotransferase system IIC component
VRRSRIAFYIPLIGYVLFEIVMVTIVMTMVPSFTHLMSSYLTSTQ